MNSEVVARNSGALAVAPPRPGLAIATGRISTLASLLATPGFLQLCVANGLGQLGMRLPSVAVAWLVLEMTGSKLWLGVVNGAPAFAVIAFSLLGGVFADSASARRVMIGTRTTLAAVWFVAAVLVTTGQVDMAYLLLVVLVSISATAVDMPVGRNLMFETVGRERLLSATAMSAMTFNVLNIVAPAGLGVLIGSVGVDAALYVLASGYAASCLLIVSLPGKQDGRAAMRAGMPSELAAGIAYLRTTPCVAWLVSLAFLVPLAGVFFAMVPLYTREVLAIGPGGLGAMLAVYGLGSLAGSTFLTIRGKLRRRGVVMAVLGTTFGAGVILFGLSHNAVLASAIGFGLGATAMLWQNTLSTMVQSYAAPEMRGRVMSIYTMGLQLVSSGWLIGGFLAAAVGIETTLVLAGAAFVGLNLLVFIKSPDVRRID